MKTSCFLIGIQAFLLLSFQENSRRKFSVEVWYESNMTAGIKYILNETAIKVYTSSDFSWRSSKLIFSKKIPGQQSDRIYTTLLQLRMDTLQPAYEYNTDNVSIFDGLYTHYTISGDKLKKVKTTTYATSTKATDSLMNMMKRELLPEQFYPMNLLNLLQ